MRLCGTIHSHLYVGGKMNKIFERIMDIEKDLNDLITDIVIGAESCPYVKGDIIDKLTTANVNVGHVYQLNKANLRNHEVLESDAKKYGDK